MGRGKWLSIEEQARIKTYHECGMPVKDIASRLNRSSNVLYRFLAKKEQYGQKKSPGRKPKLTERDVRNIKRMATTKSTSPGQIKQSLDLPVTKRRIQQILHDDINVSYKKRIAHPRLLPRHKDVRLRFAEQLECYDTEWQTIIFSDEKNVHFDGPDGVQYCWQDTRREPQTKMSRNFGGGSLMIWGAFGYHGKSPICRISTKMNADKYTELLDDALINYGEDMAGNDYIFQHDNAPIHSARKTKEFLEAHGVPVLDWPACSPDLNPIENVWGALTNRVYSGGQQFNSVSELWTAINREWNLIDQKYLQNLINSMPRRLQQVIVNRGGPTNY